MSPQFARCLLTAYLILISVRTLAEGDNFARRVIKAVQFQQQVMIDGDLSDPAWKSAPLADTFIDRQTGSPGQEQTTARILYDTQFIYVAFDCLDSEPQSIMGRETVRDMRYRNTSGGGGNGSGNEDSVEVTFDPFSAYRFEDLSRFSVNPLGTRSAKLAGGRAAKIEWQGDWLASVKRHAKGWSAEFRIPWAILNYPHSGSSVTMGLNFSRFHYRRQQETVWSNTGSQGFLDQIGRWEGVSPPKAAFRPKLSLLPYVMPIAIDDRASLRSGLDARLTLTPELTAVGAINPDFATVEGAVEGIFFSRTQRFVAERRPFFLEGKDYFEINSFHTGRYFYSNNVPRFDFGSKIYGKLSPIDTLGVLHTMDWDNQQNLVMNYRRDLSDTAQVNLFMSQKTTQDRNNFVGAMVSRARWGKFGIRTEVAQSGGRDGEGGGIRYLSFNYDDAKLFHGFAVMSVSPTYMNDNGLTFFTNYKGLRHYLIYFNQWRTGPVRSMFVDLTSTLDWHADGRPFRRGSEISVDLQTRNDWSFGVAGELRKYDNDFDQTVRLSATSGATNRFRQFGGFILNGQQGGHRSTLLGASASIRLLRKLDIAGAATIQRLQGTSNQHIINAGWEFSPNRSLGGRVVIQDSDVNWYLSYRDSGKLGAEMFFILGDPNARRFTKQVAVKFVFAI